MTENFDGTWIFDGKYKLRVEYGSISPIGFWQAKMYDGEGNEIVIPKGHCVALGKESFGFVKMKDFEEEK
jgi:hypothetical protein